MLEAVNRLTAPLVERIPDISGAPPRRLAAIGLLASILVHVLLLLVILVATMVLPSHVEPLAPSKKDLEIELVPMPEKLKSAEAKPTPRPVIDPAGLEASKEKPQNPEFESDRDMVAGSDSKPTGLLPMPSQEGRTDRNAPNFADRDVRLGLTAPTVSTPPAPPPVPASQPAAVAPSMPPLYDPNPVTKEKLAQAEQAKPDQPIPEPSKPRSTPPPFKIAQSPREDSIPIPKAAPTPRMTVASLTNPQPPSFKSVPRLQEDLKKTRVEGSISNRGRQGVNAVATPLGRYVSQIKTALASSWLPLTQERMSLITPGAATFSFDIDSSGHAQNIHMEDNTSNSAFANLCEESLRRAPIPTPPADLIPSLRDGMFPYQMTFTLYSY